MPIETHRLYLRPVIASDVAALFNIYGDPATNRFNPAGPYPDVHYAETVLERWIAHREMHGFGQWAISLLSQPEQIIGFGGLSIRSYADITMNNLGYRFSTVAWGNGLATEFAQRAVKYGFEEIKLAEISAVVRKNHLASQKVLQKTGLKYIKEIHDVENVPPSLLYSLTQEAWRREAR
ncbi:Protein N-acetyltransferase, RimJ/RimL family [Kosakonia arachidis]|uniref:Protein N-acetyltransferase, RimJ/RimL family n=1 Tax=Kosakonia arachidis TaxID=551989 RepID=A0A1I7ASZ1_9ENTR|nr:GNAT family N-acetyltransferase [Kosakonia arachidis]SFT78059.1 Protein N-acetyltransferase, RimJ/RimL family [Kosakonia arachidis]